MARFSQSYWQLAQQDLRLAHNQQRQYQNQTSVKTHYGNQHNRLSSSIELVSTLSQMA